MRAMNTEQSWGWVARLLHWGMAAIVLFQLGLGIRMTTFETDLIAQFQLIQIHKSWGFVLFCLVLLRLAWRLLNRRVPTLPPGMPGWQVRAARATHVVLYGLLIVMPVSGWVMVAASPTQDVLDIQNMVFGLFALPDPWVPGVERVEAAARAVHLACAIGLMLVLVLHVGGALKHHLVDRDRVLARMAWGP